MICKFNDEYIVDLISNQLRLFKITKEESTEISIIFPKVKERLHYCFSHSQNKYYKNGVNVYFNPFHSGQWTIFLYYLSHSLFNKSADNRIVCDKIYYLNRMLNSCDLFYEVNLPDIFFLDHPLGSVIGRGTFKNYFSFSQGCTIGIIKESFLRLEKKLKCYPIAKYLVLQKLETM